MTRLRSEILDLEDLIPWTGVIKSWKTKRGSWRKRIMATMTLQDIGEGYDLMHRCVKILVFSLKELLRCLVWEPEHRIGHSILKWENDIDEMCSDTEDFTKFSILWKSLSNDVQKWINDRHSHHLPDPSISRKRAELAFHSLKTSTRNVEQIPLESIVHHDMAALGFLKGLLKGSDVTSQAKRKHIQSSPGDLVPGDL